MPACSALLAVQITLLKRGQAHGQAARDPPLGPGLEGPGTRPWGVVSPDSMATQLLVARSLNAQHDAQRDNRSKEALKLDLPRVPGRALATVASHGATSDGGSFCSSLCPVSCRTALARRGRRHAREPRHPSESTAASSQSDATRAPRTAPQEPLLVFACSRLSHWQARVRPGSIMMLVTLLGQSPTARPCESQA
jgi:hypothetical protein